MRAFLCASVVGLMALLALSGGAERLLSQVPAQTKKPTIGPAAPQSTHYPILLLASGNERVFAILLRTLARASPVLLSSLRREKTSKLQVVLLELRPNIAPVD